MNTLRSLFNHFSLTGSYFPWSSAACCHNKAHRPISIYIFIDLCSLGESSVNVSWLWVHPEWADLSFHSRLFPPPLTTIALLSFFHPPPLVMFIQRGWSRRDRENRWKHRIYISVKQLSLAQHLFPFWCSLSTLCQRVWSPQMWIGLFSSGNLAQPTFSFFFAVILISVGKLSLVINYAFSLGERCTSAKIMYFWH